MADEELNKMVQQEVKYCFWDKDVNCAQTVLMTLSKFSGFVLNGQIIDAAIGLHGAGRFRAQCGLVEGVLMFIGVYFHSKAKTDKEISDYCYNFAQKYKEKFSSLLCYDLRPTGFSPDDPPHLCEPLAVESIVFAWKFIDSLRSE